MPKPQRLFPGRLGLYQYLLNSVKANIGLVGTILATSWSASRTSGDCSKLVINYCEPIEKGRRHNWKLTLSRHSRGVLFEFKGVSTDCPTPVPDCAGLYARSAEVDAAGIETHQEIETCSMTCIPKPPPPRALHFSSSQVFQLDHLVSCAKLPFRSRGSW